jgi:DNA uptake protein ComE-like DNA-binding protein
MVRRPLFALIVASLVGWRAGFAVADEIGKPIRLFPIVRAAQAKTEKSEPKLDLNTASEQELDGLPGIGPILAKKILAGRPYKSKDELVRRKILPQSAYDAIKDHVIAHRASQASLQ